MLLTSSLIAGALVVLALFVPVRVRVSPRVVAVVSALACFTMLAALPHEPVIVFFDVFEPQWTGANDGLELLLDPAVQLSIWWPLVVLICWVSSRVLRVDTPETRSTLAPVVLAALAPPWAFVYTKDEFFYSNSFGVLVLVLVKTSLLLAALNVAVHLLGREVVRRRKPRTRPSTAARKEVEPAAA